MPPKAKQAVEAEDVLRAVVVADSFDDRFMPLAVDLPRCLMPLCNVPLIEYTLELLSVASVQEVFVICRAHAGAIREYIDESRWSEETSLMKISVILSRDAQSMGDVLRELDGKSILKDDFILVSGDVVSNMRLDPVVEEHKKRRKQGDKNCIMTMVLKEGSPFHRARADQALFYFNSATRRCLQYQPVDQLAKDHLTSIELELWTQEKDVELTIRNDLIDCQIDICAPEVLALCSENFDYQDIRRDFVKGILESDLLGKTIYGHIIQAEYAARVSSTQMYDTVSKDMMMRWTFPFVPDVNLRDSNFTYRRNNVYREAPVLLSRSTQLVRNVVVGAHTSIGEHTVVTGSVIGRNCKIGRNVRLINAYLWDNVVVEDDSVLEHCIVAHRAVVKQQVSVTRGCLLGQDVVVGPGVKLPPHTKLSRGKITAAADDWSESDSAFSPNPADVRNSNTSSNGSLQEFDHELVGAEGVGVLYDDTKLYDGGNDDATDLDRQLSRIATSIGFSSADLRRRLDEEYNDPPDIESDDDESLRNEGEDHGAEIRATCQRAFDENHTVENTAIELNTLKMACNLTFHDLRAEVVPALMRHAFSATPLSAAAVTGRLRKWTGLLEALTMKKHRSSDELDILRLLSRWLAGRRPSMASASSDDEDNYESDDGVVHQQDAPLPAATVKKYLAHVFKALYDDDLISEDAFLAWSAQSSNQLLKDAARPFIEWLQSAEEEDDSSDEEED
ncbi:translation initiation factor eIF-2B epsilon subunit, GEF [Sorochytrium milnesiophthora]